MKKALALFSLLTLMACNTPDQAIVSYNSGNTCVEHGCKITSIHSHIRFD